MRVVQPIELFGEVSVKKWPFPYRRPGRRAVSPGTTVSVMSTEAARSLKI